MSNFNTRIKLKRDTAVNWTVNNPVLLNGEIILVDTDSGELRAKVGDGTKTYTQLPFTDEILKNLITGKQNKLTGTQGQIVGFGEDGSAQPEDFPGLTQTQGDERYLPKTGGNVTGLLRLAPTETGGSLYFGESIDGSDGMINSSNGTMGISVGTPAENRVMMALYESTGELALQVKKGSDAGNFRFSPNGLDMKMKPILNCPTLDGKQNKLTGTQGQVVGFDESGNAVAQAAPQTGMTQDQADQRYVQQQNGNLVSLLGLVPSGVVNIGQGFDADEARVTPVFGEGGNPRFTISAGTAYMEFNANDEQIHVTDPVGLDNVANKRYVDNKVNAIDLPLAFGPQIVASSAWASSSTYSAQGYSFRASVPLSGVTADHIPDVTFAMADAVSGNLAPLADAYAGGIYIYAKEQPSATVNIASVVCTKGA